MDFKDFITMIYNLSVRTFTMVYMIATALVPPEDTESHEFLDECSEWLKGEFDLWETQQMIDELYK